MTRIERLTLILIALLALSVFAGSAVSSVVQAATCYDGNGGACFPNGLDDPSCTCPPSPNDDDDPDNPPDPCFEADPPCGDPPPPEPTP